MDEHGSDPLGTLRDRITVTQDDSGLTVRMPVRRTRRRTVFAVLLMAPLIYAVASILVSLVGFGLIALRDGGAAIAAFFLGVLVAAFRELPFILFGMVGAYFMFGTDTATITQTRSVLRKEVFRAGYTYRSLSYTENEPIGVDVAEDTRDRTVVRLALERSLATRRWDREFVFGEGILSEDQAASLLVEVETALGDRPT